MHPNNMAAGGREDEAAEQIKYFTALTTTSDVIFQIDGEDVYFCKSLLIMASPVFERMFTSDFIEKRSECLVVPLPGKVYGEFLTFLKQFHPSFSWIPIKENEVEPLLKLADEYDVQHVKDKCESFMRERLKFTLTADTAMWLLWLTHVYRMTALRAIMLELAAENPKEQIEASSYFNKLDVDTQLELMKTRSGQLELGRGNSEYAFNRITGRKVRKLKELVRRLPDFAFPLQLQCSVRCMHRSYTNKCIGECDCRQHTIEEMRKSFCSQCAVAKTEKFVSTIPEYCKMRPRQPGVSTFKLPPGDDYEYEIEVE